MWTASVRSKQTKATCGILSTHRDPFMIHPDVYDHREWFDGKTVYKIKFSFIPLTRSVMFGKLGGAINQV